MDNYRYPLVKSVSILNPGEKKREGERIAHTENGKRDKSYQGSLKLPTETKLCLS